MKSFFLLEKQSGDIQALLYYHFSALLLGVLQREDRVINPSGSQVELNNWALILFPCAVVATAYKAIRSEQY